MAESRTMWPKRSETLTREERVAGLRRSSRREANIGLGGVRGIMIGVVTFVLLLGGILAAWGFVVHQSGNPAATVAPTGNGALVYHTLIDRYVFATTLPPLGDRTVTFEYSVAVQIKQEDRKVLEDMIAQRQLLGKLQADIRKVISQEEYTKLRSQELGDVAREVRDVVNADLGQKLFMDVIFPVWNVW